MANADHLEILRRGVHTWNEWRRTARAARPDLRRAYLPEANLRGFDLREADLRGAMLLGADASGADLRGADLSHADARYCKMHRARLHRAVFHETQGAQQSWLRAAEATGWRARLPRWAAAPALAVAALGVFAWLVASAGEARSDARTESARETIVVPVVAPPAPAADIEGALRQARFPDWTIERVAVVGGALRLRLDAATVDDTVYLPTLAAACGALLGRAGASAVRRIEILDRDERRGWIYEAPTNCESLLRAPHEMLRLAASADSRPYRAANDDAVSASRRAP